MLTKSAFQSGLILVMMVGVGCAGVQPPSTDASPTRADVSPPPEKTSHPPMGGVDPTRFTPYFEKVRGGPEAITVLDSADYESAREAFLAIAQSEDSSEVVAVRARFVAAVCAHRAGLHEEALLELPELVEPLPLIADHIRYLAAVSAYRADQFDRALELANDVSLESPLRADAELLVGDTLRSLDRSDEVESHYRSYVHRRRGGPRLSEAMFKLARAIEQRESEDELGRAREAIRWYRRILYRYPRSSWARQARERVTELAESLSGEEANQALDFSADEQLELAEAYARVHRHSQAMEAFSKVLELTDPDGPIGCQARLGLGRAAYNGRQRKRAKVVLSEAAERCDEPDIRAWSLYLAGRAHTSKGDDRGAVEVLATLEEEHPEHRLADDARLRRAHAELRLGKAEEFTRLLEEFPDRYPQGDMLCEAQWQLAWHTYREGTPEEALTRFQFADQVCTAPEEGAGGRERYWAARTLEKLGRRDEALRAYESVALENPLTFYMLLAVERLDGLSPSSLPQIWRRLGSGGQPSTPSWRFDPRALKGRPGFMRGIELHRVGLSSLARIEFAAADSDLEGAEDLRWLSALLHHKIGSYTVSHWIARRDLTEWQSSPPAGDNVKYWHIAYPRGFAAMVGQEAENADIEQELIWGVMREESGFSPTVESYANAVGLLQLLPTTARRFAKGLPANRSGLKRPENNIPIAARFLAFLLDRQQGSPVLAVASYNAGEGAVDRWRRANPDLEIDEALETFSYGQTRRYTRRVLSSYGTYHYLYSGRLPRLLAGSGTITPSDSPAPTRGAPIQ